MAHRSYPPVTPPSVPEGCQAGDETRKGMEEICSRLDCPKPLLDSVLHDSLEAARMGEFEHTFVFFAFHGNNIYRQPTDVRDFLMVQQSISYHTGRDDYKLHGTVTKTAVMGDPDAIVCQIFSKDTVMALAVSLSTDDYSSFEELKIH